MALSTIGTAAIADDAITAAKIDDDGTGFTFGDVTVTNDIIGNVSGRMLLDASAASTDVGEEFLLDGTDVSATNAGSKIVFESATDDVSSMLKSGLPGGITINDSSLPAGSSLQVVQVTKLNKFSMTSSTYADITGFAASITPSSSTSKILVMVSIGASSTPGSVAEFRLLRGSTEILLADAEGNRSRTTTTFYAGSGNNPAAGIGINYLDSPNTTSEITYKMQIRSNSDGTIVSVNRNQDDTDAASISRSTSTITLMEVAS